MIVRQPNGSYAIFNKCVDDFVLTNATRSEIIDHLVDKERVRIISHVSKVCDDLDSGRDYHYQVGLSFSECLKRLSSRPTGLARIEELGFLDHLSKEGSDAVSDPQSTEVG